MERKEKGTLEDYLIGRVKKSGYPLEIEVSDKLETEKFVVFNTQYYFDEEAQHGRDIDIYAIPLEPINDDRLLPLHLSTDVAIECKRSETHAWIFYTRPRIPMSSIYISGQLCTTVPRPRKFSSESFEWLLKQKCLVLHHDGFERIAIAYDEIKKEVDETRKKNTSRREIFEAVNQLVKFTCYESHQTYDRSKELSKTLDREYVAIFFPIIVFDGDLFEVSFDSGEPRLERKNHMLLSTHYRCPYCREVESFTIDIVHLPYFDDFLRILKTHFCKTRETMLENHDELLRKAKKDRANDTNEKRKSVQ
jgi:hypothetical protein